MRNFILGLIATCCLLWAGWLLHDGMRWTAYGLCILSGVLDGFRGKT